MKNIRFTKHSLEQCHERGTNENEIIFTIENGSKESTKKKRFIYKYNFQYNNLWQGKFYHVKQVAPVIKEEENEIVVITVYTFYF
jgi:hypothetical protein